MENNQIELHGQWTRSVGGRDIDFVNVPGSYPPLGECTLEYEFDCSWPSAGPNRFFLGTEGVLASARFMLNGQELGMLMDKMRTDGSPAPQTPHPLPAPVKSNFLSVIIASQIPAIFPPARRMTTITKNNGKS